MAERLAFARKLVDPADSIENQTLCLRRVMKAVRFLFRDALATVFVACLAGGSIAGG